MYFHKNPPRAPKITSSNKSIDSSNWEFSNTYFPTRTPLSACTPGPPLLNRMETTPILISSACPRRNMTKNIKYAFPQCLVNSTLSRCGDEGQKKPNSQGFHWLASDFFLLSVLICDFSAAIHWGEWPEVPKHLKAQAKRRAKHCCCSSSLTRRFPTDMRQTMVSRKSFQIQVKDKAPPFMKDKEMLHSSLEAGYG